jgi:gliding motility-associated protein GldM
MTADVEDKKDYETMDKTAFLDEYFFKGDGFTVKGQEFIDKVDGFRNNLIAELGDSNNFVSAIKKRFNTDDVNRGGNKSEKWLKARYEGFPLVASLTNLTQMQADIKNTEADIVASLLGNQLDADSKLTTNNYKGIVSLNKTAYFAGEKVSGQVVLGRYDSNIIPTKVTLNGRDITNSVENGQVMLDMPAGNVGEKTIKGVITFMQDGKEEPIPFESKYSVIAEPSSAVVSADKMNVVYRGLDNPISVSLPGVSDNNLKVSAAGGRLSGKGSSYSLRPGAAKEIKINVSAKLSSGKTVNS